LAEIDWHIDAWKRADILVSSIPVPYFPDLQRPHAADDELAHFLLLPPDILSILKITLPVFVFYPLPEPGGG
jgi:hypothetical protein